MSGEKIQRYDLGGYPPMSDECGRWMKADDVDTALASRDATIKTQGEEIAELRASVESKTAAIGAALEQMHGEDWAWCIPEIKAGLSAAFCSAPLAPGAKSAREVKQ